MNLFLSALQFLTIIPIHLKEEIKLKEISKSVVFFPLVGLFLGFCLVFLEYLLIYFFPASIARLALIVFLVIITGGLHIDGFSDTVDVIASRKTGDEALKIMRESTVGPIGVSAIFILLLAKYIALGEFFGGTLYAMLLFFPMMGRMAIVTACYLFPYARKEGKGLAFIGRVKIKEFVISGLFCFIAGFILVGLRSVFIFGFITLTVIYVGKYFIKIIGGITGDTLGFFNEIGELVALLGVAVVL